MYLLCIVTLYIDILLKEYQDPREANMFNSSCSFADYKESDQFLSGIKYLLVSMDSGLRRMLTIRTWAQTE